MHQTVNLQLPLRARLASLAGGLAALVVGLVVALAPLLTNAKFYFRDDMQQFSLPTFRHIGAALRQGEWPLISLSTWLGGNLFGEHQHALMNPVSLATYAVLPSFSDLYAAAAFLGVFYTTLLTLGAYVLAQAYGARAVPALAAAAAVACNNFVAYWLASDWIAVLVSLAWFVWAWAALTRAHVSPLHWLGAITACYLTVTAGWPQTTLLLAVVAGLVTIDNWGAQRWHTALLPLAAAFCGALMAAPALLAVLPLRTIGSRPSGIYNTGFLLPNFRDVLALSSPFHQGHMYLFGGYKRTEVPFFYAAWFMLPLLPFVNWRRFRGVGLVALGTVTLGCLVATQGPEQAMVIRWPFRLLPYAQIAAVVGFVALVSRTGFVPLTRGRAAVCAAIALFGLVSSLQSFPESMSSHLWATVVVLGGALGFTWLWERRPAAGWALLTVITLGFGAVARLLYPANLDVADWNLPRTAERPVFHEVPSSYAFTDGVQGNIQDPTRVTELRFGQTVLDGGRAVINGYTPIGYAAFAPLFCFGPFGETCPGASNRLHEIDAATGVSLAELMRVDRIVLGRGYGHINAAREIIDWPMESRGRISQTYHRPLPGLPGTLSWAAPGLGLTEKLPPHATREEYRIGGDEGGLVVFARLAWPGYHVQVDGRDLKGVWHRGFLVSAVVPPGSAGKTLSVVFRPPFWRIGLALAFIGVLTGLLIAMLLDRLRSSLSSEAQRRLSGLS
jgi:hypothetical protein